MSRRWLGYVFLTPLTMKRQLVMGWLAGLGGRAVVPPGVGAGAGVYGACEVDWGDEGRYGFGGGWW